MQLFCPEIILLKTLKIVLKFKIIVEELWAEGSGLEHVIWMRGVLGPILSTQKEALLPSIKLYKKELGLRLEKWLTYCSFEG